METKLPLVFGNWIVNEDGISFIGAHSYFIDRFRLAETIPGTGKFKHYNWLTHLVEKRWLLDEDIYALNSAWVFAMNYFEIKFDPDASLSETLSFQFYEMRIKKKQLQESDSSPLSLGDPQRFDQRKKFYSELEKELENERHLLLKKLNV